jgi:predicted enzyme related to lactoylglutathione lyase
MADAGGSSKGEPEPTDGGRESSTSAEIADITFDCVDPERVAAFWASMLGRPIAGRKGPYVWLERSGGKVGVGFQRVRDATTTKNRVHLDLGVGDLVDAAGRAEALGGRRASGYEAGGFLVMLDPEGNQFCLVPPGPISFDDEGRADYLDGVHL